MRALAIAIALALAPLPGLAQDYDAGLAAYNRGDYATALQEWRPLAEHGDAWAQFELGMIYRQGKGVAQDDISAHMWLNIATDNGLDLARFHRDTVASDMTAADIFEAQRSARVCMASAYQDCD